MNLFHCEKCYMMDYMYNYLSGLITGMKTTIMRANQSIG